MRSKLVVLVTVALLVIPSAVALGEDSNPFKGSWVGIDDTDGSRNMLIVGGGNNHVVYRETGITACLGAFDEFVGGSAAGFATIDGNELTFTGTPPSSADWGVEEGPPLEVLCLLYWA